MMALHWRRTLIISLLLASVSINCFASKRNDGMRIDHVLSSGDLFEQATQSYIDLENRSKAKPSDHAPVFGCFKISE